MWLRQKLLTAVGGTTRVRAILAASSCSSAHKKKNLFFDMGGTTRVRAILAASFCSPAHKKNLFFDMVHSNNAARIRLWLSLKGDATRDVIETRRVTYADLKTTEYAKINPLKKVPALVRDDGTVVFESSVILAYLEDKYRNLGPHMVPATPEGRQEMELLIRIHDLYIASPNCTAPGFSHSQGAMYLSYGWHGPTRGMDLPTRAAKMAEIWKQLHWLEAKKAASPSPWLVANQLTLADMTWFPTCVFMEFLLPRFFGWPALFDPKGYTPFPHLASWYTQLRDRQPFARVREDIWLYWEAMVQQGQFQPIMDELASPAAANLKFAFGAKPTSVMLNYQELPPHGKTTGRYVAQPDRGDVVDKVTPAPELGFELRSCPTRCRDFGDDDEVVKTYYGEMIELVKAASGAKRVLIFDHTIRQSDMTNLNASPGGAAAPVPRVHCDYTAEGAPRRLKQLGKAGFYSRVRGRMLNEEDVEELARGRYAFINVWRSLGDEPVERLPLAVCEEGSTRTEDRFKYEIRFPDRTGETYSLKHSPEHRWYYYPRMTKDECLVFKVYDKGVDGPRFIFHTAFEDPSTTSASPPRRSIEARAVAFFEDSAEVSELLQRDSQDNH